MSVRMASYLIIGNVVFVREFFYNNIAGQDTWGKVYATCNGRLKHIEYTKRLKGTD